MKAIVNVKEIKRDEEGIEYDIISERWGKQRMWFAYDEIKIIENKPMNEIKLTEEQFNKIDRFCWNTHKLGVLERLKAAKEKGWIVKSAVEEWEEFYDEYYNSEVGLGSIESIVNKAQAAIKELQEKINE